MLFLGPSSTMSLNHHRDLTLNHAFQHLFKKKQNNQPKNNHHKQNQPLQQISSFSALSELSSASERESSPFCCPCRDAEFMHTVATTTGQPYCDILKLFCMLRNQMLPPPLMNPLTSSSLQLPLTVFKAYL